MSDVRGPHTQRASNSTNLYIGLRMTPEHSQSAVLVSVPVVDVWIVRMRVHHRFVPMLVRVRSRVRHWWIGRHVHVLMMFVVCVRMIVLHPFVSVLMLMPLGEM